MSDRPAHIPDGAAIVVEAESLFHAQTLVAVLEDHGIDAIAAPDVQLGAGIHPDAALRPVPVLTTADDAEQARAILAENAGRVSDIDWDQEIGGEAGRPGVVVGRMPLIAKAGLIAGLVIIALMVIGALLMAIL